MSGAASEPGLTLRFTDFFTDFEEKTDCFAVYYWLIHFGNLTVGADG